MKSQCSSADVAEQFLATDWNPLVSEDQNINFNGPSGLSSYHGSTSNIMVEQFRRPSIFNNGSIPGVMNSVDLLKNSQISSALGPPDLHLTSKHGIEKNLKGKKRKSLLESSALHPDFPMEIIPKKVSPESIKCSTAKDEKKWRNENPDGINHEPTAKHTDECSQDGDAPKEDYIHIRARRGQATNSHSLAERVRREKISERMKLLQDLVPGCNKINGKAMMLDEIINYVQSLQRQVEFLSMKLSAVNPDLPFDIEQILSKDILHSRDGSSSAFGCGPALSNPHPHFPPQGIMQQEIVMRNIPNSGDMLRYTIPHNSPMTQLSGVWDDEFQTVLQMGFIPNPPLVMSDPNGSMKMGE